MRRILKIFRKIIIKYPIQNRMFISSVLLATVVVITINLLSQNFLTNIIIKKQAEFESSTFEQAQNYFKSMVESVEGRMQRIHNNEVIKSALTTNFSSKDILYKYNISKKLNIELDNIFFGDVIFDNAILIGANNMTYFFNPLSPTDSSQKFIFDSTLFRSKLIEPFFERTDYPFYFSSILDSNQLEGIKKQIYQTINNKLILIRTIKNGDNIEGLLIITLKNSFISNILTNPNKNSSLYLIDNNHQLIWTNDVTNSFSIIKTSTIMKNQFGHSLSYINGEKQLITYNNLLENRLFLITSVSIESVLHPLPKLQLFSIFFALGLLVFVFIISYIFSKKITNPLKDLAVSIQSDSSIPLKTTIKTNHLFSRFSLKKKLVFYFAISVIFPVILYISIITYLNYNLYYGKVTDYAISTMDMAKKNIDYKFELLDDVTTQFIYSQEVQEVMQSKYEDIEHNSSINIEKVFLNSKSTVKEFLTFHLYDTTGNSINAGLYSDYFPTTNNSLESIKKFDETPRRILFSSTSKDLSMNPVLFFYKYIYSSDKGFGHHIGYSFFSIDQDFLNKIFEKIRLGSDGFYFLVDPDNKLLTSSNDTLANAIHTHIESRQLINTNQGNYTLTINGQDYLAFYDTVDFIKMKVVGVVPLNEIRTEVLSIVQYSLISLLLVSILIIISSTLIASSITKPIQKLSSIMDVVKNGNFNVNMPYTGKDEIAILTTNFNDMVFQLNRLINENYQSKIRESELKFLENAAQLNALQQQINPHFLYNTLDSIKWMAYKKGVTEVSDMAIVLGKLFRFSITQGSSFVSISEEIEHLNNYIYIQKIRFLSKFDIIWSVDDDIKKFKTIKLILQPFIENTIIHGFDQLESGGLISIKGYIKEKMVVFEIDDNGVGMSETRLESIRQQYKSSTEASNESSIGISNVYKRLKLNFEDKAQFEINSQEGIGTKVRIAFPIIQDF